MKFRRISTGREGGYKEIRRRQNFFIKLQFTGVFIVVFLHACRKSAQHAVLLVVTRNTLNLATIRTYYLHYAYLVAVH